MYEQGHLGVLPLLQNIAICEPLVCILVVLESAWPCFCTRPVPMADRSTDESDRSSESAQLPGDQIRLFSLCSLCLVSWRKGSDDEEESEEESEEEEDDEDDSDEVEEPTPVPFSGFCCSPAFLANRDGRHCRGCNQRTKRLCKQAILVDFGDGAVCLSGKVCTLIPQMRKFTFSTCRKPKTKHT